MSVKSRANMTGRKVIYTDVDTITAENVVDVLKIAVITHAFNRDAIDFLYEYNNGNQPILQRVKEVRPEINNKIVVNRANEITSFKVGYLLGEPIQYVSRDSEKNDLTDKITQLNEFMYAEDKAAKIKNLQIGLPFAERLIGWSYLNKSLTILLFIFLRLIPVKLSWFTITGLGTNPLWGLSM